MLLESRNSWHKMRNLSFHRLSQASVFGWGAGKKETIDVFAVVHLQVTKRLFRIMQRDFPYTLKIATAFEHPIEIIEIIPIYAWLRGRSGLGFMIQKGRKFEECTTRRYRTAQEAEADARRIVEKRERVVHKLRSLLDVEDAK